MILHYDGAYIIVKLSQKAKWVISYNPYPCCQIIIKLYQRKPDLNSFKSELISLKWQAFGTFFFSLNQFLTASMLTFEEVMYEYISYKLPIEELYAHEDIAIIKKSSLN